MHHQYRAAIATKSKMRQLPSDSHRIQQISSETKIVLRYWLDLRREMKFVEETED